METVYRCSCHGYEFKSMYECQEHERIYTMIGANSVGKIFWQYPTSYCNATFVYKIKMVTEDGVVAEKLCVRHDEDNLSLSIYELKTSEKKWFFDIEMAHCVPIEDVSKAEIEKLKKIIKESNLVKIDLFLNEAKEQATEKVEIPEVLL